LPIARYAAGLEDILLALHRFFNIRLVLTFKKPFWKFNFVQSVPLGDKPGFLRQGNCPAANLTVCSPFSEVIVIPSVESTSRFFPRASTTTSYPDSAS